MGWALKQSRSHNTRFTDKQKDYLVAKYETGEQTGQKADAASVLRLMRSEKDERRAATWLLWVSYKQANF